MWFERPVLGILVVPEDSHNERWCLRHEVGGNAQGKKAVSYGTTVPSPGYLTKKCLRMNPMKTHDQPAMNTMLDL